MEGWKIQLRRKHKKEGKFQKTNLKTHQNKTGECWFWYENNCPSYDYKDE